MSRRDTEYSMEFSLEGTDKWLQQVERTLPSVLENNILRFKPEFGSGSIHLINLQEGLKITFIDIEVKEDVYIKQIPVAENCGFVMDFHKSEYNFPAEIGGKEFNFGIEDHSVSFISSMSNISYKIFKNRPIRYVHLYFTREWLLSNVVEKNSKLYQLVTENQPVRIFEHLDYNLSKMVKLSPTTKKVKIFTTVFNMFNHIIEKIEDRDNLTFSSINPEDMNVLLSVRHRIETSSPEIPTNLELANSCHMSLSKFMRLFKQVFGTTPYQYHLDIKMDRAMQLIQSKKCSVSEVCDILNYQSQGNFSKVFKKKFGLKPQEVI